MNDLIEFLGTVRNLAMVYYGTMFVAALAFVILDRKHNVPGTIKKADFEDERQAA